MRRRLSRDAAALSDAAVRLDGLSPLTILGRGYAIATRGRTVARCVPAAEVAIGDEIAIRLGRGSVTSRVHSVTPDIDSRAEVR